MGSILRTGKWKMASRIVNTAPDRVHKAIDRAVLQEAQYMRKKIVEGIREQAPGGQAFKPLAPTTLTKRKLRKFRGTKALIERADLRNGFTVKRIQWGAAFVGLLRTAKNKTGKSLANIGEIHEYGSKPIVIRITPKMRKFLHVLYAEQKEKGRDKKGRFTRSRNTFGASKGFVVIQIPARPFMAPVVRKYFNPNDVKKRFFARVGLQMRGDLGSLGLSVPK